jgi:hypothetical protein
MATTYEPIATTTLGTAATTITLSSIPATYTDLRLIMTGTSAGSADLFFRFNGVTTGTLYSTTRIDGEGATVSSAASTSQNQITTSATFGTTSPIMAILNLFSYAGSTNKTCLWDASADQNGSGTKRVGVGLFRSTSAITSISVFSGGTNMDVGTKISLYGILKA